MTDKFLASIKLITQEEVLGTIEVLDTEDNHGVLITDPMIVEEIIVPDIQPQTQPYRGFSLSKWIRSSSDSTFYISMDKIITISELKNPVLSLYKKALESNNTQPEPMLPNKERYSGHRSYIHEARKKFEDLFNNY